VAESPLYSLPFREVTNDPRRRRHHHQAGPAGGGADAFHAIVPDVRAEKGCIEYVPVVDALIPIQTRYGPDTFVVPEKWESLETLKAHGVAPHMAAYAAQTKEMVADRAIYILSGA
jgi:quinol monooxygenase YgiN